MKENNSIYNIIEVANTHGGDIEYLKKLVKEFDDLNKGFGIKFQPLHPEFIATPDFKAFDLYKKLHFNRIQWKEIIEEAANTKDVWLDIFDTYGVDILQENLDRVYGIKFQSSVLYNFEVINALNKINFIEKKIILNVAAQSVEDIEEIIERIDLALKPEEILLEFGYQAYPTSLEDSGLSKLALIKKKFNNRIVFADHVDGASEDALWLPVVAAMMDVDCIEKHVMLEKKETLYDHFSSLTPLRYKEMVQNVNRYVQLKEKPFINEKEREYLSKTLMKPLLKKDLSKGAIPNLEKDFMYRRSNKNGLQVKEIQELLNNRYVLSRDVKKGEVLEEDNFRKAKIGIVVICRMKSSRLPKKALLKIGSLSSVEYCIKNVLKLQNVDKVILATSTHPDDEVLKDYTYSDDVEFYRGDPEDVMQRMVDVVDKYKLDIVTRVTADMPIVSNEIYLEGLKNHFANGADFTRMIKAPIGVGTSIISANALIKAKELFPTAEYSEYLTYYFINNPSIFKILEIEVPERYQKDFRLTLDYEEDLIVFREIEKYLATNKMDESLDSVLQFLEKNPEIAAINRGMIVKYLDQKELIDKINKHSTVNPK